MGAGNGQCGPAQTSGIAEIKNDGQARAGTFAVRMLSGGVEPENGTQMIGGLDAGQETIVQFGSVKLKEGDHTLRMTADLA